MKHKLSVISVLAVLVLNFMSSDVSARKNVVRGYEAPFYVQGTVSAYPSAHLSSSQVISTPAATYPAIGNAVPAPQVEYPAPGGITWNRKVGMTRETIRSLPILERPNRVGHFVGNTVRRRSSR